MFDDNFRERVNRKKLWETVYKDCKSLEEIISASRKHTKYCTSVNARAGCKAMKARRT